MKMKIKKVLIAIIIKLAIIIAILILNIVIIKIIYFRKKNLWNSPMKKF